MSALSQDEALLAELGYKQEFKRDFSRLELFGLSFSIIGVVQSIAAVLIYAIPYGGPVSIIWGWAACSVFLVIMALAMAELGSAAPTSGGLYYWTFTFCSPRYRNLMSWIVGYSDSIGYISGLAGGDYAVAVQILTAVSLASGGSYSPTTAQIYGVYAALLLLHTFLASMATKTIARLQIPYMSLNILVFLGIIIAIPVATPSEFKNDAAFALGTFENLSLWPNGFAFFMAFLAPAWSIGGFNSSLHISEEARNASRAVPFAIICSVTSGCILGWIVNLVVVFYMGTDMNGLLSGGQPMLTIIFQSFGLKGTLAVWSFIIVLLFMSTMDLLISVSRQMFAFSRDGALPFSRQIYYIHPRTKTPVVAVAVCTFCALLLGLLSFAGSAAITAIFTMSVVCQYIAYSIPIAARWMGGHKFQRGPFHLGVLSFPIAFIAVAFMTFMIIILLFPVEPAPDSTSMNYTVVVVGGILLLATFYYFFPVYGGRYWFKGPVANIDTADAKGGVLESDEKSESFHSSGKDTKG